MHDVDCVAQGGTVVNSCDEIDCNSGIVITENPEGCLANPHYWGEFIGQPFHTPDLCEQTVMQPTFVTDDVAETYLEPVSDHDSRPLGSGVNACIKTEGFIALNEYGEADFYVCTRRAYGDIAKLARGFVFLEKEEQGPTVWSELGEAGFVASTEAPFYLETFLHADPTVCMPALS